MADPLHWNRGEGYDIHVLRGGPPSKSLVPAVIMPAGAVPGTLKFMPQFVGAPSNFGVVVDTATGVVSASPPPPNQSRTEINNFLMTVSIQDNTSKKYETEIRIHVHDAITDIWLTPPTLTIHKGADECRFTVLAAFNDGTTGDITDWSQLTYQSRDRNTNAASTDVLVSVTGVLQTITPGKTANIIVSLIPPLFSTWALTLTATAQAIAKESWSDIGAKTEVTFVADKLMLEKEDKDNPKKGGTVVPNKEDPSSGKRDSVASVVTNALNILFVSEGFSQKRDFDYLVSKVVTDLRTNAHLQPFNLVRNSINYWSVFLPSQVDGITLLGDYAVAPLPKDASKWHGDLVPLPEKPAATATTWSLEEMIHEVGLPVAADPKTLDTIKGLWELRSAPAYVQIGATDGRLLGWLKDEQSFQPVPDGSPLEPMIVREDFSPDLASRVEIGQLFEKLLADAGVPELMPDFRSAYAVTPLTDAEFASWPDRESARFRQVVAGRVVDGLALYRAAQDATPGLPSEPAIEFSKRDAVRDALTQLDEWIREIWGGFSTDDPPPGSRIGSSTGSL